ncbi:MAG: SUMF1/EgtB/PvdO family nonheme iron enzyme [Anaerolineae bacterium]|jgi:formylglycine-generating enzyme required for sulfatase activity
MVVVPAGEFLMGQDDGPRSSRPQRRITLDRFAIDRTEVTNAAVAQFVAGRDTELVGWDAAHAGKRPHDPAVGLLWREADAYCRWAGKRLPTEAEWEKAARGTDGRRYPWGDTWDPARANSAESGLGAVATVGSFPSGASPYGVLDMAGNAAEWVADTFDPDYYLRAPEQNPPGPGQVLDHGLRGGSWASPREHAQTFFRDSSHSVRPNPRVGFRCARSLDEKLDRD